MEPIECNVEAQFHSVTDRNHTQQVEVLELDEHVG